MATRRSQDTRRIDKLVKLMKSARTRYVYFVCKKPGKPGYWWELVGPDDRLICSSLEFDSKHDCLQTLRMAQRHAATLEVRDDDG